MWISLISYCFIFSNSRFWKISQFLEILVFWIKSFSILSHLPPAWEQNELLKHQHPTPHHWIITIDNITIITLKHQLENKNNNDNIEIPTSTISETKCRELPVFSSMPFVQLETFLLWLWTLNYGFAFQWYQMMPLIIIIIIIINHNHLQDHHHCHHQNSWSFQRRNKVVPLVGLAVTEMRGGRFSPFFQKLYLWSSSYFLDS